MSTHKVFLGGTCANSTWRNEMIPHLKLDYYNPLLDGEWHEAFQQKEEDEKEIDCDIHFYLIMHKMEGVFSIAEVMDSVHQKNKHTILQVQPDGFSAEMLTSLKAVIQLVIKRGGQAFIDQNLEQSIELLNANYANVE